MKLVAKYTLVLAVALTIALALLAVYRVSNNRDHFEHDMELDHRVVGRVLQAGVADLWREPDGRPRDRALATRETLDLIRRANQTGGAIRFAWVAGPAPDESQRAVGHDFVSRFPVRVGAAPMGTVEARESFDDVDRLVATDIDLSAISIGLIVVVGLVASLALGRWLVGQPIRLLVEQARRIGRREFSGAVAFRRSDELGELATEMRSMSDELAAALATIAVETEARVRAVEQLRHADRLSTVGKLAAGVAHELGTPLSIVSGHAQMIAGREVAGDGVIDSARAIDRESGRMSRIVRQLLDFARRRGPQGTTCDPGEIARRCLSFLAPMIERAGVRGAVAVTGPPVRALIDEDNLQQVLTNLVVNAVQAMPGGGALTIGIARVHAARPEAPGVRSWWVRVEVGDTGGGLADEVRAHLFEPFVTTKQPGDGTGLGLAVVYGIVVDHRGSITVDTGAGGTTFSLYLQEAAP